jgi:translocation and assembly module TamA
VTFNGKKNVALPGDGGIKVYKVGIRKIFSMLQKSFIFLFFLFFSSSLFALTYEVRFLGLKDLPTLKEIKSTSDLVQMKKKPPPSINALRYRMERDLPQLMKVLRTNGYYDATITSSFETEPNRILITLTIQPGQRYHLGSYKILIAPASENKEYSAISLKQLGLNLKEIANERKILQARLLLLSHLAEEGYPLATIENQEVIADGSEKAILVTLTIQLGPLCRFGSVSTTGLVEVSPRFLDGKITWKRGDIYSATQIDETQKKILESDLFSSVMITHSDQVSENQELPMKIHLTESKHKSLSLGISYATVDHLGCNFSWSHRNLRHMGEQLSLEGSISQRGHFGLILFRKPDFLRKEQDFVAKFYAEREDIFSYLAFTYGTSFFLNRKFKKNHEFSLGVSEDYIDVTHSANDGRFVLFSLPLLVKCTTTTNLLNPTKGYTLTYKATPSYNTHRHKAFFLKETLTLQGYFPIVPEEKLIFAMRVDLGSIIGSTVYKIPLTKLFLGGSYINLRGYKYRTVSPRNSNNRPIGGKGAIFFNFEPRLRFTSTIGIVPFFDMGCVSKHPYPTPKKKWYKSTGIGLRYFTFFGPLSIDIGFPLNRRSQIDPPYQLYASIGQTF